MSTSALDPQVVPYLLYEDAGAAMDWLIRAFGFPERARDRQSDGTVRHGELLTGNGGVIMLGSPGLGFRGPAKLGEVTQLQCITISWRTASAHRRRAPGCPRSRCGQAARTATPWMTPRAIAGTSANRCSQRADLSRLSHRLSGRHRTEADSLDNR
jgi:hypothetical protein